MDRIRKMAEEMIEEEPELFFLPENNLLMSPSEYNTIMGVKLNSNPE